MGYVHAEIKLKNPRLTNLKIITVKAMVDTGALTLVYSRSYCTSTQVRD